ncbi:MAG TPA: hypothetical protein VFY71_02370 [Planctomycetota bacterium]|nr:hypothetical protein [Planctomycetota bacterium]
MRASIIAVVSLLLAAPLCAPGRAQDTLLGGTSGSAADGGILGTLDQSDASWTTIGDPTAAGPLPGLALDSTGALFGANNAGGGSGPATLIQIDPATGLLIATVDDIIDDADAEGLKMSDIAFQPGTDVLFGMCATTGKDGSLYTIDVTTASATLVGATGLERGGLAFAPDGTLWLATVGDAASPVIAQIDPTDASVVGTAQDLTTGLDALAVRPSDGVLFGVEDDSSNIVTIDPADGSSTPVGLSDGPASIASLTFAPGNGGGGTVTSVVAYILPKVLVLKLNALDPEKSKLTSSGFFDLGPDEVDLTGPATLDIGFFEVTADELVPNAAGTVFKLEQPGLKFTITTDKLGSSRAKFKVQVKDDLDGLIDPDSDVTVEFTNDAVDGQGTVTLENGKFKLGKKPGALIEPVIYLFKVKGTLKGGGEDSLQLKAGFATDGTTPDEAPDFSLDFAGNFSASVASSDFEKQGDRFVFKGEPGGLTSVILDYKKETITLKAKGVDLGDFDQGPQPVDVTLGLGDDLREVSVRMVRKNKLLKY